MKALGFFFFVGIVAVCASAQNNIPASDVIEITAEPLSVRDNVETYPEKVRLSQPEATSPVINDSLKKLPGALVTQFSGPGSQSAIISPFSTGSGGTLITVDGIPVQAPLGRGNDLVFFAPSFFKAIDWYSPFYPWAEGLTSAGGRLDLITREAKSKNLETAASTLYGTANSFQIAGNASQTPSSGAWLLGVTGFYTDGNFNYVDPYTKEQKLRENNDNRYVALMGKKVWHLNDGLDLSLLSIAQTGHRTDPGPLADRNHGSIGGGNGHDTFFGLLGLKLKKKSSWLSNHRENFITSYSSTRNYYTNLALYNPPAALWYVNGGENTANAFLAYQVEPKEKHGGLFLQADAQFEEVETYYPLDQDRQTFGATVCYDAIKLSEHHLLIPRLRVEQSSTLGFSPDLGMSYIYQINSNSEFFAGAHFIHRSPSMIHLFGYLESGMQIQGNRDLPNERIQMYSLGYNFTGETTSLWLTTWYSRHNNVGLRTTLPTGQGSFDNVPEAYMTGVMADVSWSITEHWYFRQTGLFQRAENLKTNKFLTYKPAFIANTHTGYDFTDKISAGIENQWIASRYFSASNSMKDEPYSLTTLRADVKFGPGVGYVKLANLFDSFGYDNPGFPLPGRSFWVGYSVENL